MIGPLPISHLLFDFYHSCFEQGQTKAATAEFEQFLTLYWDRAYVRDYKLNAESYLALSKNLVSSSRPRFYAELPSHSTLSFLVFSRKLDKINDLAPENSAQRLGKLGFFIHL